MSRFHMILALFGALAAGLALAAPNAPTSRPAPRETTAASWDQYQIITTRNIFLRDRSQRYRPSVSYSRPPRPASDEDSIVLTGIVQQGLACVAFFENTRTGETTRVAAGQPLGAGTLAWICLESIGYQGAGGTRTITVGQALSGENASLVSAVPSGSTSGPATATTTSRPAPAEEDEAGLPGEPAAPTSRPVAASTKPADNVTSRPAETTGGSNLSVEERMRLNRQKELRP